jgi:hypothetical protein
MSDDIYTWIGDGWYFERDVVPHPAEKDLVKMGWQWEWDTRESRYLICAPDAHIELLELVWQPLPDT